MTKSSWPFPVGQIVVGACYPLKVNIYEGNSPGSAIIAKSKTGETVTIIEGPEYLNGNTWWLVNTNNRVSGWIIENPDWFTPFQN